MPDAAFPFRTCASFVPIMGLRRFNATVLKFKPLHKNWSFIYVIKSLRRGLSQIFLICKFLSGIAV